MVRSPRSPPPFQAGAMSGQAAWENDEAARRFAKVGYELLEAASIDCGLKMRLVRCAETNEVQVLCQGTDVASTVSTRSQGVVLVLWCGARAWYWC